MLELPPLNVYDSLKFLGTYKHSITRFRIEVHLYLCDSMDENTVWIALESLSTAPLSSLTKKAIYLYEKSAI
jgi:adenine-specific DNA glycosylase